MQPYSLAMAQENLPLAELLEIAKEELKFKDAIALPRLLSVSINELRDILCPKRKCHVNAIYMPDTVYYDEALDLSDPIVVSIMYHEIIHHVQRSKYGPTYNCKIWRFKELQARKLQYKFLKAKRLHKVFDFKSRFYKLNCPRKE